MTKYDPIFKMDQSYFSEEAVFTQDITLKDGLKQNTIVQDLYYQVCDDRVCIFQDVKLVFNLNSEYSASVTSFDYSAVVSDLKLDLGNSELLENEYVIEINKILTLTGDNILENLSEGMNIYNQNSFVTSIESVTSNSITVANLGSTLVQNVKLQVDSFRLVDAINNIYNLRYNFTDSEFNYNYSYKLVTINDNNEVINEYILNNIEINFNGNYIKFSTDNTIEELTLRYDNYTNSGYFDNIRLVLKTINTFQSELPASAIDNKNNLFIQRSYLRVNSSIVLSVENLI
jgi:hypothetical protein